MPEFSSLGFLLTLLKFLLGRFAKQWTKDELLASLQEQNTVRDYLEWLRKKGHAEILHEIEATKIDLINTLLAVQPQITVLGDEIRSSAGDLIDRIEKISSEIRPPALYSVPLETRPSFTIKLRGRDRELNWLCEQTTDALVLGQPGSGKTFLLQEFAGIVSAQFLITDDPDAAIAALISFCPRIVVVDDAWKRREIIARLRHLRTTQKLGFHLISACWPFEREDLRCSMQIPENKILVLELLPRPLIVEVVQDVAAARKVRVNSEFLRIVAQQARGLPGLAVSLASATIDSTGHKLASGEILLDHVGIFMQQHVAPDVSTVLSAFACAGERGVSIIHVANILRKDIPSLKAVVDRVALAGVLEQTGPYMLAVQPAFLRAALIAREFLPSNGAGLGWELLTELVEGAVDRVSGYLEVIRARAVAGAQLDDDALREIAEKLDDYRIWRSLAWLDPNNCQWVLSKYEPDPEIKKAALHHVPERILPLMLSAATRETRDLNSAPEADMRLIEEWIESEDQKSPSLRKRSILLTETIDWLSSGKGNSQTALEAIARAFDLTFNQTDLDPTKLNTITLRRGLVPTEVVEGIFEFWPKIFRVFQSQSKIPWHAITQIVEKWSRASPPSGEMSAEYSEVLNKSARKMVSDLIPLAKGNNAASRWLRLEAQRYGVNLNECTVEEDFIALYPDDRFEADRENQQAEQIGKVKDLVKRWLSRPISEVVWTFREWSDQIEELGGIYSEMPSEFCTEFAKNTELTAADLELVLKVLKPQHALPFVRNAILARKYEESHIEYCLSKSELCSVLIQFSLRGQTPELYDRIENRLVGFRHLLGGLCVRCEIPEDTLRRLLQHSGPVVRFEVALGMFRSKNPPTISEPVKALWRTAVVNGLFEMLIEGHPERIYDLSKIVYFDPSMAPEVLEDFLSSGPTFHGINLQHSLSNLVQHLTREQRRDLLPKCSVLSHSALPDLLVGSDIELFKDMLAMKELQHFHLGSLQGDPTDPEWIRRAKLALEADYSHEALASETRGGGYSWSGNLSDMYQQWVDRFEKLKVTGDPDLVRIAGAGLGWAIPARDRQLQAERKEAIFG